MISEHKASFHIFLSNVSLVDGSDFSVELHRAREIIQNCVEELKNHTIFNVSVNSNVAISDDFYASPR